MKKIQHFFLIVFLILFQSFGPCWGSEITIGVSGLSEGNHNNEIIKSTILWLKEHLKDYEIKIKHYSVEDFYNAVRDGEIDFSLCSAGLYRASERFGIKDIATTAFTNGPDPNHNSSSLIIARKDRNDLQILSDLKGKIAVGTRPLSITGLIMGLGEIAAHGYDPDRFFSEIKYTGYPMHKVVKEVVDGKADVGFLWACYYESLMTSKHPDLEKIKPINLKPQDALQCKHSTETYPGHTFAVTPKASPEAALKVAKLLFSMPKTEKEGFYWTIATDFHSLDTLFKLTRYGPYSYLREWTVKKIWEEYKTFIIAFLVGLVALIYHSVRVNTLVRIRTEMLNKSLEEERRAKKEARSKTARIESLERMSVVQQMSSMFAHELKQPMAAIGFYVDSLISRLKKGTPDTQLLIQTLERVSGLNKKSSEIVNYVRSYGKKTAIRKMINISQVIDDAVQNFVGANFSDRNNPIQTSIEPDLTLEADPLEVEIIVLNLLKNAVDAVSVFPESERSVWLKAKSISHAPCQGIAIEVTDNGPSLDDETFAKLCTPFNSSKKDGLGLGLTIVSRIAESYGGKIEFLREPEKGITVRVELLNTKK